MYYPIPIGKLDERFIKQHFTIKGGFDQGELDKKKAMSGDELFHMANDRAILKVDLIE